MDDLVRYVCVAHRVAAADRSPVTVFDSSWAYCVNGWPGDHDWRAIEPSPVAVVRAFGRSLPEPEAALA